MTKLYLITGFLGSGKTTFLHNLVRLFPSRRLAIVVNEFGKVGVDGVLLSDLSLKAASLTHLITPARYALLTLRVFKKSIRQLAFAVCSSPSPTLF